MYSGGRCRRRDSESPRACPAFLRATTSRSDDGRLAARAPVDDVLAAIDQALFVEADEGLAHGAGEMLVHGEVLARTSRTDAPRRFICSRMLPPYCSLPLPDALDEFFAAQCRWRLLPSLASWRSTIIWVAMPAWSVPGSQSVCAQHAMPADEDVHLRVVEHVAHVQAAGDVGRRQQDVKTGLVSPGAGVSAWKRFSLTQYSAQRCSMPAGIVSLWQFVRHKTDASFGRTEDDELRKLLKIKV